MMNILKNKSRLNLIIDVIMFILMMIVAGMGLLLKFVLLPGFKRNEIYGNDVELYFMGLDRHDWGSVHLIFSLFLIALVIIHIILHWKMIVSIFKKMIPSNALRWSIFLFILAFSLFAALSPLKFKPEIETGVVHNLHKREMHSDGHMESDYKYRNRLSSQKNEIPVPRNTVESKDTIVPQTDHQTVKKEKTEAEHRHHDNYDDIEIMGYMTMDEIGEKYKILPGEIADFLNIPRKYTGERLGRLRKTYDFHMDDIREFIVSKTEE